MFTTPTPKKVRTDLFCVKCGTKDVETCKQCGHTTYCDQCGMCNLHGEPRAKVEPTREWSVNATFYPKKGSYTYNGTTVVKANGLTGAMVKGMRELKKELVKPRTHLKSTLVQVTPMPKRKEA